MRLEIKELDTAMVYDVGPEGAVLGRERARTDIAFRDESISKRHARIYIENGSWYLEDLGSSNGTYVDNQRLTEPYRLSPGMSFSLAQKKFEIVLLDAGAVSAAAAATGLGAKRNGTNDYGPPLGMNGGNGVNGMNGSSLEDSMGLDASADRHRPLPRSMKSDVLDPADGGEEVESKGFGYFFVAVPKAIAYYLATVPLFVLNPVGTIRRGVTEQKLPAMGRMELIAYALPALLATSLVGLVFRLISGLIAGSGIGGLIGGMIVGIITSAIGSVIGAVVIGFAAHPVLRWLINFLKGQSSAKSRTNYIMMTLTVGILLALPSALGAVISVIPVPFIGLIPPLLSLVATAVTLFVAYLWVKEFGLVKWVQYVVLVLGALAVLGTAVSLVTVVVQSVSSILSGGSGPGSSEMAAVGEGGEVDVDALKKKAEELSTKLATGEITAEAYAKEFEALSKAQEAAVAKAREMAEAAQAKSASDAAEAKAESETGKAAMKPDESKAGKAAQDDLKASKDDAKMAAKMDADDNAGKMDKEASPAKTDKPADAQKMEAMDKAEKPSLAAKGAKGDEGDKADKGKASMPMDSDAEKTSGAAAKPSMGMASKTSGTSFKDFIEKRKAIEEALENDPRLMRRKDIQEEYRELWEATHQKRQLWAKKKGKNPAEEKINARLKDADVYDATHKNVDRLYQMIFGR